jgi:hypothetical protein
MIKSYKHIFGDYKNFEESFNFSNLSTRNYIVDLIKQTYRDYSAIYLGDYLIYGGAFAASTRNPNPSDLIPINGMKYLDKLESNPEEPFKVKFFDYDLSLLSMGSDPCSIEQLEKFKYQYVFDLNTSSIALPYGSLSIFIDIAYELVKNRKYDYDPRGGYLGRKHFDDYDVYNWISVTTINKEKTLSIVLPVIKVNDYKLDLNTLIYDKSYEAQELKKHFRLAALFTSDSSNFTISSESNTFNFEDSKTYTFNFEDSMNCIIYNKPSDSISTIITAYDFIIGSDFNRAYNDYTYSQPNQ